MTFLLIGWNQFESKCAFFLIAPELACLAGEAEEMAGFALNATLSHHVYSLIWQDKYKSNVSLLSIAPCSLKKHLQRTAKSSITWSPRQSCR